MREINLLYVITKLELGGAQKQLLSLISRLNRNKFRIFLFTAKDGLLLKEAQNLSGVIIKKSKYLERAINPLKDIPAFIELGNFIRENKIDIVHTHSSKAGILGRLAARRQGVRVIIHTVHGWSFNDYQPAFLKNFYVWLERISAKFTDKLIVVSNHDRQNGLKNRIGSKDKYICISYGTDDNEFREQDKSIREEFGLSDKDLLVGTVSCLKPQKSPQDFIKLAFLVNKVLADTKFILVGDGILRKKIEKLVDRLNLNNNVILAGWRRDIPRVLSSIDVFVLTSLWEGLPVSVLEAIKASRPVVATNTGGIAEVIEDGKTGFLIQPKDMFAMRDKLALVLRDKDLRIELAQAAKANLGPNFSFEHMAADTQGIYENLLNPGSKAS